MYSKYTYFILLGCLVLLSNCGVETLKFTEPQPKVKKNLTEVEKNFIGKYKSLNDDSVLIIDKQEIRSAEYLDTIRFTKAEFDSLGKYEVKEDGLYELGRKLKYPLRWENDTAVVTHAYTELYFNFLNGQVLRYHKNKLFLNYPVGDGLWKVEILSLKADILTWYVIRVDEDNLKSINEVIETIEEVEKKRVLTKDGQLVSRNDTTIIAKDVKTGDFKTMINSDMLRKIGRYKRIDD